MNVFVQCSRCGERGTPHLVHVPPHHLAQQAVGNNVWRLPDGWTEYETLAHRFTVCPNCKSVVDAAILAAVTKGIKA